MLSVTQARETAQALVERATTAGADAADAIYIGDRSSGVQVRLGELEDVQRSEGEEIGLRLFRGTRSASVVVVGPLGATRSRRWSTGQWRWPPKRPRTNMPGWRQPSC